MRKKTIFLVFFLFAGLVASSQSSSSGKRFWIGFIENLPYGMNCNDGLFDDPNENTCSRFYILISTRQAGLVSLSAPGFNFKTDYYCDPNKLNLIELPTSYDWIQEGNNIIHNAGLLIESQVDIEVVAFHRRVYFSESTYILPENQLGRNYTVMSMMDEFEIERSGSSFIVVSPADNTEVELIPSCDLSSGHKKNTAYRIKLNKGEIYQVRSVNCDLSGTIIRALDGKKVAAFSGSKSTRIFTKDCEHATDPGRNDNHIYEQLLPDYLLGKEYVLSPYKKFKPTGTTLAKILSLEDHNRIIIPGSLDTILNRSQHMLIPVDSPLTASCEAKTMVATFTTSSDCNFWGDPSMNILKPTNYTEQQFSICNLSTYISSHRAPQPNNYLQLIFTNGKPDTVAIKSIEKLKNNDGILKNILRDDSVYVVEYTFTPEAGILSCWNIQTDKKCQAIWYSYSSHDAFSTTLGYTIPEQNSSEKEKIYYSQNTFDVLPNPITEGQLKIRYRRTSDQPQSVSYRLYNSIGQLCVDQTKTMNSELQGSHEIAIDNLAQGTYYLRIDLSQQSFTKKLIYIR